MSASPNVVPDSKTRAKPEKTVLEAVPEQKAVKSVMAYAFHGCGQHADLFTSLLKPMKMEKKGWELHCQNGFYRIDQGYSWYPGVQATDPPCYPLKP